MATTTTNYGFDVPTSSDLVKNGATQIALLGQDLDTFLFRPFTHHGLLNSSFNVWQRGTSPTWTANNTTNYQADRWLGFSVAAGRTVTRQATNDTTNLPNIQYCARVQRTAANTATDGIQLWQIMESVNSIPYAGKQVTLSYYARAGANFSGGSNFMTAIVYSGTGTDQNPVYPGYTGQATPISGGATLTTTWQRFTQTATIASTATELSLQFAYSPTGTAGANDYFEVTGVMLEVGSQASPYCPATPTYATELAACQRYYYRNTAGLAYAIFSTGFCTGTTAASFGIQFPVTMRTAPASVDTTGTAANYAILNATGSIVACSAVPVYDSNTSSNVGILVGAVTAGLVAGNGTQLRANNSVTSYIGWSAEL
jgi:hypothetical protein